MPRVVAAAEHSGQPDESADAVLVAQAWHWLDPIAAAQEAAISRLYGGIHFRAAIERGVEQGVCIGAHAVALKTLA